MQMGSIVKVADNSGPKYVRVIKILGRKPKSRARIGDFIICSVQSVHDRKKFKVMKGSKIRCMVIRIGDIYRRKDGHAFRFDESAVVAVSKKGTPRGTNIYGPIAKEIRQRGYLRLVSLSTIAL